jgi:hypothetical protein
VTPNEAETAGSSEELEELEEPTDHVLRLLLLL